jgi:hypothetical protein
MTPDDLMKLLDLPGVDTAGRSPEGGSLLGPAA